MSEVIQFKKTDQDLNTYLHVDKEPFTVCKIVRIKEDNKYIDFKAKQVSYVIMQVPGFKIFLVHAGFLNKPESKVPDEKIEEQVQQMVEWYAENKTLNKREKNYYQLKNNL